MVFVIKYLVLKKQRGEKVELDKAFTVLGLLDRKHEAQLLTKDFSKVLVGLGRHRRNMPVSQREQIQKQWENHTKDHPNDFDGVLASLKSGKIQNNVLCLETRPTNFSIYWATRKTESSSLLVRATAFDRERPLPLSFGAITVTAPSESYPEGCIVVAKRGQTAFNEAEYTFLPGGYFDPGKDQFREAKRTFLSLESAIIREAKEELNCRPNLPPQFLGLVFSRIGSQQPLIAIQLKLFETTEQLKSLKTTEWENQEIFFVPNNLKSLIFLSINYRLCTHDLWKLALYVSKNY